MDVRSLVLLAQQGDLAAFDQLISLTDGEITNRIARSYGYRGREFVQGVRAATLRRVWRLLGSYDPDRAEFISWFWEQVRHEASLRARALARNRLVPVGLSLDTFRADESPDPAEVHEAAQVRAAVWCALRSLPREERFPVILAYWKEYSVRKIAERQHIGVEAVRYRLEQGKSHLARQLRWLRPD